MISDSIRRAVSVFRGEREIQLSKTEFDLLALLVANRGIVLDHSTIYDRIWHYDFGPDSKNLAVYIGYLRRKTEAEGEPRVVHTVRGVGYTARIDELMGLRWKIALSLATVALIATSAVGLISYRTHEHATRQRGRSLDHPGLAADGRSGAQRSCPHPEPGSARGVLGSSARRRRLDHRDVVPRRRSDRRRRRRM